LSLCPGESEIEELLPWLCKVKENILNQLITGVEINFKNGLDNLA